MTLSSDLKWSTHVYGKKGLISQLNSRLFTLCRLSKYIPRGRLGVIADGLWTSKVRYGLALYGKVRLSESDPKCKISKDLQIAQNKVLRVLTKTSLKQRVPTRDMLEMTNMMSINQMTAQARLLETWKAINVQCSPLLELFQQKVSSALETRSARRGDLVQYGASNSFQNQASKLWNWVDEEMKSAKSFSEAQRLSKVYAKKLPI